MNKSENYQRRQEILYKNKQEYEQKLQLAIEKYRETKASNIDKKEARLQIALHNIKMRENALNEINNKLIFLRPATEEDISYRLRQYDTFSKIIEELIPDELPLRFHGCSIYNAKAIIKSGGISSSVDRLGFETSYDVEDQISVTTRKTIDITVQGYADLIKDFNLPAGCIFVLMPKDKQEEQIGDSLLMHNINFKKEPDRLFGIITTLENLDKVKTWMLLKFMIMTLL